MVIIYPLTHLVSYVNLKFLIANFATIKQNVAHVNLDTC